MRTFYIQILLILILPISLFAQDSEYDLSGKIVDISGNPVANVSVGVEGVAIEPVFTNDEGLFEITVPLGNVRLLITPVDQFYPRVINLNNRRKITIYLSPYDLESLDENIDLILESKKRKNILTSYNSYDPEKLIFYPYETIDQYFQGSIPGMYVINNSGMPGSGTTSYLRGMKSLVTNNQPLYVVDGIPLETFGIFQSELSGYTYNPLTSLEPFDISNVTVLKDNHASSLFGVRGSNGVVLIETLKPTELSTTIDFLYKTGIRLKPDYIIPQMDNNQHRTYGIEVLTTSDIFEEDFPELYPALFSDEKSENFHRYKHNTNWQDMMFQNGVMNEIQLRMKGGDEIARYGLSVGYMKKNGIIKSSDYERINIRLVGTFNIFRWLRMYVSTHLNRNSANLFESALTKQVSPILTSLSKTPMMDPYSFDRDGNRLSVLDDIGSLGVSNPYSIYQNYRGGNRNNHSINSIRLEGDITENFKLRSLFGINLNTLNEDIFMPNYGMAFYYDGTAYNVSKKNKNFLYAIYFDNSLSYSPQLGPNHSLRMDLGVRINTNRLEQDLGISKNSFENDEYESLQNGVFYLKEIGGRKENWNRLGAYYNLSYNYLSKYLFNFAFSSEFSSRFGSSTNLMHIGSAPFANFYSIGTGWRISSENFMKNLSWIEEFKLRLSYGISGNDDIGNTNGTNFLRVDHYRETTGVIRGNLTDGSLKNETYSQFNGGLDISLFGNRYNLHVNYYNTTTKDMLVYTPQPFYTGFNFIPTNNGTIITEGIEILSNYRIINTQFKWDVNLSIMPWQKSLVEKIEDNQQISSFPGGEFITKKGQTILEFYGYQFDGVISSSEEAQNLNLVNEKGIPFVAGDAKFLDLSGPQGTPDNVINEFDKISLGSPIPDIYGGFNTTFTYNRWSLNFGIYFVYGNEIFNYVRYENEKMTDLSNQSKSVLNRWHKEGQDTDIPRALWGDPVGNSSFSSRWIEDGSFIRLKNITLSYTIPNNFLAFRNMQIYATMDNVFTLTNYLGYDPEFSFSFKNINQGIDYGLMPLSRGIIAGIKVGL